MKNNNNNKRKDKTKNKRNVSSMGDIVKQTDVRSRKKDNDTNEAKLWHESVES